jgi:hypothetical protein
MDRSQVVHFLADVALGTLQMEFTYRIKTQAGVGTCFLYGKKEGFFYVTAAHLVKGVAVGENVLFDHKSGWIPRTIEAIFVHPVGQDLAVIITNQEVGGEPNFDATFGVMPGQPVKFLGFPHGLRSNYPSQFAYSAPLVRSANFSGVIDLDGVQMTILDGFNNPGYSGGPVYCCGDDGQAKLFGVISGYRPEIETHSRVYKKNENGDYEPLPDFFVRPNSGMIHVVGKGECDKLFAIVDQFQPTPAA